VKWCLARTLCCLACNWNPVWYTKRSAEKPYNENNGQRKRYKRRFADVSVNPVIIIGAFAYLTALILLQVLVVSQQKSAMKTKTRKRLR